MIRGKQLPQEIVERKRFVEHPSPMEVLSEVSEAFGVNQKEIMDRGNRSNTARKVAIYLCQRYTGLSNEAIRELFGGVHYSAVSKVTVRIRKEMLKDKALSKLMKRLNSQFKA